MSDASNGGDVSTPTSSGAALSGEGASPKTRPAAPDTPRGPYLSPVQKVLELQAENAALREVLKEIAALSPFVSPESARSRNRASAIARAALATPEERDEDRHRRGDGQVGC